MTRSEFINEVNTWSELTNFCYRIGYEIDEIWEDSARDDYITESLQDNVRNGDYWGEIRDWLDNLDSGSEGDYWRRNDYGEWFILDDNDLEAYKSDVLEYADDNELFDAEDEGEDDWPWEPAPIEPPAPPAETGVTLDELFMAVQVLSPHETNEHDEEPSLQILF